MSTTPKAYPSDVCDAEWEFLLPYLTLMREDAPRREYPCPSGRREKWAERDGVEGRQRASNGFSVALGGCRKHRPSLTVDNRLPIYGS